MHRPICRLVGILLVAGSIGLASAEPNTQTAPPNNGPADKQAGTILDARQKAVDDIRYGRVAPYYLFPPAAAGPKAGTSSPPETVKDKKK
jgi:hypothetical protein